MSRWLQRVPRQEIHPIFWIQQTYATQSTHYVLFTPHLSLLTWSLWYHKHIQKNSISASVSCWSQKKNSNSHKQDVLCPLSEVILAQLWSFKNTVLEYSTHSEDAPGLWGWTILWQLGNTIQGFQIWQAGEYTEWEAKEKERMRKIILWRVENKRHWEGWWWKANSGFKHIQNRFV